MSEKTVSRRDFIKLAGLGLGGLALNPFRPEDIDQGETDPFNIKPSPVTMGGYIGEPGVVVIDKGKDDIRVFFSPAIGPTFDPVIDNNVIAMKNPIDLVPIGAELNTISRKGTNLPYSDTVEVDRTIDRESKIWGLGIDPQDAAKMRDAERKFHEALSNAPQGSINAKLRINYGPKVPGTYPRPSNLQICLLQNPETVDGRLVQKRAPEVIANIALTPTPTITGVEPNPDFGLSGENATIPARPILLTERPEGRLNLDTRPGAINKISLDQLFSGQLAASLNNITFPKDAWSDGPQTGRGGSDTGPLVIPGKNHMKVACVSEADGSPIGYNGKIKIVSIAIMNLNRTYGLIHFPVATINLVNQFTKLASEGRIYIKREWNPGIDFDKLSTYTHDMQVYVKGWLACASIAIPEAKSAAKEKYLNPNGIFSKILI